MNLTQIPKSFKLLGCTIKVDIDNDYFLRGDKDGYYGFAIYRESRIVLRPQENIESMLQTFFHELTHFVLYNSGYNFQKTADFMHQEEGFVDMTASLFHQALTTMVFEDPIRIGIDPSSGPDYSVQYSRQGDAITNVKVVPNAE